MAFWMGSSEELPAQLEGEQAQALRRQQERVQRH